MPLDHVPGDQHGVDVGPVHRADHRAHRVVHRQQDVGLLAEGERADPVLQAEGAGAVDALPVTGLGRIDKKELRNRP
ncbi:hypothetical protein ABZW10_29870 [Kitasatospora sp. NPDC004723]|uniref:hypothetical protein n=1 Tax=Kitasatospora sp. NPDC004723 TaxID=3154288 RepID=UPI0033B3966A